MYNVIPRATTKKNWYRDSPKNVQITCKKARKKENTETKNQKEQRENKKNGRLIP